jgi:hypothetical protein
MPIHDWTRVPAYVDHDFHTGWLVAIRRVLNSGVLPSGYYARAEQTTRAMGPDILTLQERTRPVGAGRWDGAERSDRAAACGDRLVVGPTRAGVQAEAAHDPARQ